MYYDTMLSDFCALLTHKPNDVGILIVPILQIRKLSHNQG